MQNFSLDRWSVIIVMLACSLIWLPAFVLFCLSIEVSVLLVILFCVRQKPREAVLLLVILYLIYGQALSLLQQAQHIRNLPHKINQPFRIVAVLQQQDYQRVIIETRLQQGYPSQRIYTNWQAEGRPQAGEIWQGELLLRPLSSRLNHQGFDRQQWAFAHRITLQARIKSAVKIGEDFSWREQRLRRAWQQTEHLSEQGLLLALAFGERAWVNQSTWQIYQRTNTAHLIAISGLHIGIAMGIGFSLCRLIQILLPSYYIGRALPLISGVVVAGLYAQLAGFSIPTLRAIMALLVFLFFCWQRGYCTPWQLFIRTLASLLLYDPIMPLSASFWLSVGAVASLILWYQLFPLKLFQWQGKGIAQSRLGYVWGLLHLQFGLLWLFTPIQLAIFQGFSLYSFWANLIAVPFYSLLLVPLVLFATLTEGAFASWYWANELLIIINHIISYWQTGWLAVSQKISLFLTALCTLLLIIAVYLVYQFPWQRDNVVYAWQPVKSKLFGLVERPYLAAKIQNNFYFGASLLLLYCLIQWGLQKFSEPIWRLETLDVGQGLATLLVKNNRAILYDTGASWQGGDMASIEILPYLARQGIKLEQLIISHDDNDHSGGVASIIKQFPQVQIIQASTLVYRESNITLCKQGTSWQWQELSIRVLSPPQIIDRAKNTDSCVLLIDDGRYRVLLTGDADIAAERQFVQQLTAPVQVLQVGHHGSKTATSELLLERIKPEIALISTGRWNPWQLPNAQVLQRLQRHQAKIFNTAIDGQISLKFYPDSIKITTARDKFSPWYRIIIGSETK